MVILDDGMIDIMQEQEKFSRHLLSCCEDMRYDCRKMLSYVADAEKFAGNGERADLMAVEAMALKIEKALSRMEDLADKAGKAAEKRRKWVFTPPQMPERKGDR